MKQFILAIALALAIPAFAADKKPAEKPAVAKKAEKKAKKKHPEYKHEKAEKKAVPARDTSAMPKPAGGPSK